MTVSDIGSRLDSQFQIRQLQDRIDLLQERVSTGKKGASYDKLSSLEVTNSLVYRRSRAQIESFQKTIGQVRSRINVMDSAMENIRDSAVNVMAFLQSQLQGTNPPNNILTQDAQDALENVLEKLNVQFGGRYLFAGTDIENRPHDDEATLNANFAANVVTANIGTPGLTQATVLTDADAQGLGFSATLPAAGNITARIDDGQDVDYTVRADDSGFSDIIRGLATVSNLTAPTNATEEQNYWTIVNASISMLQDGIERVDELQGLLGNRAQEIEERDIALDELEGDFRTFIGENEDIDVAETLLELQDLDFQLEASYRTTTTLRRLSLVNFL